MAQCAKVGRASVPAIGKKTGFFDGWGADKEHRAEKSIHAPGRRISGGGGFLRSRVSNESVSNRDDYRDTFLPQSPLQKNNNQETGKFEGITNGAVEHDSALYPPAPPADLSHGLEPPPMPPGLSYKD